MPFLPDTSLPDTSSHTPFRLAEKYFKNRSKPGVLPSLRNIGIVDLSRTDKEEDDEVWRAGWWGTEVELGKKVRKGKERSRWERPALDIDSFGFERIFLEDGKVGWIVAEGCILIPRYLRADEQLDFLESALTRYTLPPNPLSLSAHYNVPPDLFAQYAIDSAELVPPLAKSHAHSETSSTTTTSSPRGGRTSTQAESGRKTVETEPSHIISYEEVLAKTKGWQGDEPSDKVKARTAGELMTRIRWANLGWVYHWSTKSYNFTTDEPIQFPPDLADLCSKVVKYVPWNDVFARKDSKTVDKRTQEWSTWRNDYSPDTGIVNFYQINDTLMGHVDRAELDPSRPLVSISLGHAAVFLLGTSSRHDSPRPIILRSGDVLIMSGKGRQSYHGVPRILEGALPAHFEPSQSDDSMRQAVKRFISTARVNINARQVFPPGFQRPRHD